MLTTPSFFPSYTRGPASFFAFFFNHHYPNVLPHCSPYSKVAQSHYMVVHHVSNTSHI